MFETTLKIGDEFSFGAFSIAYVKKNGGRPKIGIKAPPGVRILREELAERQEKPDIAIR